MPLFTKFEKIVSACFGCALDANYQIFIDQFFDVLDAECIPYINKLHYLKIHVPEFIKMEKKSLGFFSEQGFEAVHYNFNQHKINYLDNASKDNRENALLRAVNTYNCYHLFQN